MLTFTLLAKQAKTLVKALENVSEDAVFQFDKSGLHISVSDTFRNRLLEINLPKDFFESYNCEKSIDLGIIVSRLRDVTKTLKAKEELLASYQLVDPNFLILSANGVTRRVRLVNTTLLTSPPLMVYEDYIYQITLNSKNLQDFLKAANNFHTVDVAVDSKGVNLVSKEGEDEVSIYFDSNDTDFKLELDNAISTHGLFDLTKGLSTIDNKVIVRGGPTIPISFQWDWGQQSQISCYLSQWE